MPLPFSCPSCGLTGNAADDMAGRLVSCPRCKEPVRVVVSPPTPSQPIFAPSNKPTSRRSPYYIPLLVLVAGAILAAVGLGLGGGAGTGALLLGGIVSLLSLVRIAMIGDTITASESRPPKSAEPAEPPTELEVLESIEQRLMAIEAHSQVARSYAGCLLAAVVVALLILFFFGIEVNSRLQ